MRDWSTYYFTFLYTFRRLLVNFWPFSTKHFNSNHYLGWVGSWFVKKNQYNWRHTVSNAWQYFIGLWIAITCHQTILILETHDTRWFYSLPYAHCFQSKQLRLYYRNDDNHFSVYSVRCDNKITQICCSAYFCCHFHINNVCVLFFVLLNLSLHKNNHSPQWIEMTEFGCISWIIQWDKIYERIFKRIQHHLHIY